VRQHWFVPALVVSFAVYGGAAQAAKRGKKPAAAATPKATAVASPALVAGTSGAATVAAASPTPEAKPTPHAKPPAAKVLAPEAGAAPAAPTITLSPPATVNGGASLARIDGLVAGDVVTVSFAGETLPVTASTGYATTIVGVDLNVDPGKYTVTARVRRGRSTLVKSTELRVTDAKYEVQKLTLPKEKVSEFDAPTLARIEKEAKDLAALWPQWDADRRWSGKFIKPLPGEWSELFGGRRILNGELRSPHAGIDQRGKEGEPIKSINAGRVVYTGDQFFTGNVTVVDHGQGVFSMYCHQSKILVKVGDSVRKGETIGLVGHTGRATGPHLHWGVRIAGARVDPQKLLALDLPETPGAPAMVEDTAGDALPTEALPPALATSGGAQSASSTTAAKP